MAIIGYARVSTVSQDLESQLQTLKEYGCGRIYSDKHTGTKRDRPEFNRLLEELTEGDTLVVTKLDRMARNTREGIDVVRELFDKGVRVHVLNVGMLEDTTMGRFFLTTMLAVAEMERDMIIERTQEGKAIAKQRPGYREGRPRKHKREARDHAMTLLDTYSYTEVERMTGISKASLVRYRREQRAEEAKQNEMKSN